MKKYIRIKIYAIVLIALCVAVWDYFSSDAVPSPLEVFECLMDMIESGALLDSIKASLFRYVIGFLAGAILGIACGILLSFNKTIAAIFDPLIQILRPISPIAWFPIIVLAFGIGDIPAIYIIGYSVFFPMLLLSLVSVREIDKIYFDSARNFGASKFHIFIHITLPGSFTGIASALKLTASLAWINLVVGEMVGAQSGLGYMIVDYRNMLQTDGIIAAMISIGIIGYVINVIFDYIQNAIRVRLGG